MACEMNHDATKITHSEIGNYKLAQSRSNDNGKGRVVRRLADWNFLPSPNKTVTKKRVVRKR